MCVCSTAVACGNSRWIGAWMQNAVVSTVLPLPETMVPSCVAITRLFAVTSAQK